MYTLEFTFRYSSLVLLGPWVSKICKVRGTLFYMQAEEKNTLDVCEYTFRKILVLWKIQRNGTRIRIHFTFYNTTSVLGNLKSASFSM